jgi:CelD/BcsL family acetyltransferase involved in cellulose biosynthesis
MIQVERIEPSQFPSLRAEWNELLAASGSENVHLRHEWLSAWTATLGRDAEPLLWRLKEGTQTLGFAPLMLKTVRLKGLVPYRQVLFLSDPDSDFADFVIVRQREEALRAVFGHLSAEIGWGEVLLHALPEHSPNVAPLRAVLAGLKLRHEFSVATPCYFIRMAGRDWEQYLASDVNAKFVSGEGGVQKRYTYYKRVRWEVQENAPKSFDDALYEHLAHMHECSQTRKERASVYRSGDFRHFLERVAADFAPHGWLRLILLNVDGKPISYILGFENGGVFYHWNIGFDLAHERMAPSKFLLWHVLKDGFENRRWKEFNFMRGATDYKTHWTQSSYNLLQIRILNTRGTYGALNLLRKTKPQVQP